jgi:TRAP-type C4-dicarboxylate transport system permease small subunit
MWLRKGLHVLDSVAVQTSRVAAGFAAAVLTAMMALTGLDVIMRYIFDRPVSGTLEITEFMMAIVIAFGLAYCAVQKRHVRIDIVISRFPKRAQALMDAIANLAFLGLFVMIAWRSALRMQSMFKGQLTSAVLFIPKWPFLLLVIIGSAILCIVVLRDSIDCLTRAIKK